jgi:hypothetical protein
MKLENSQQPTVIPCQGIVAPNLTKKSAAVAVVMRKLLFLLCVSLGLLLCQPAPVSAAVPGGTIELSGGRVAAGLGYSWGR